MDFVRSYLFTNETLGSWTLFSSKLDSPLIKTLETHSLNVKKCLSNVLITEKSNFDERNGQLPREFHSQRSNFLQIHTLTGQKIRENSESYYEN